MPNSLPTLLWRTDVLCLVPACLVLVGRGQAPDETLIRALAARSIGPAVTGGRIDDVAVVEGRPSTIYLGTASGGVWKTTNNGTTWRPIFDDQEVSSIGDIAIVPSDPETVWVGTGEPNNRQSSTFGRGIYRSSNGGATWMPVGLQDSHHIGRIVIDPTDPNIVYVAAQGHLWGPNRERGLFRTVDSGRMWNHVLCLTDDTGVTDMALHPRNRQVVYAASYQRRRTAWGFNGGGPDSGIHKSTDGGRTFADPATGQPGANRAMGSVFDVGVHSDFHALWIDPGDSDHLILGGDGGLYFSYDGSVNWDHVDNIPIGQFYAIGVDRKKPYTIYGGLQDNHSFGGPSATRFYSGIPNGAWVQLDSGDGTYQQVDPRDPSTVYTTPNNGALKRFDGRTGNLKRVRPMPAPGEAPYSSNWTASLLISPHNPDMPLFGGNRLFISLDRGDTWKATKDLTRMEDRDKSPIMGVFPSPEMLSRHDGISAWGTITALAESPVAPGTIWVGTDDDNLQLSRDGGATWTSLVEEVSGLPARSPVSRVEASSALAGRAYVAFDRHQYDDFAPYLYRTNDFGRTWSPVTGNLPRIGSVNVVKEHPRNPDVLFVGTETRAFVSPRGGDRWIRLAGLPTVPDDDIVIHPRDNDLVVATHGRSLYVIDDITAIVGLTEQVLASDAHLFPPRAAVASYPWKQEGYGAQRAYFGQNQPAGALIAYYLMSRAPDEPTITVTDAQGRVVRSIRGGGEPGLNRVVWDLRYAPPEVPPTERRINQMTSGWQTASIPGPFALPGTYTVAMATAGRKLKTTLRVDWDPVVRTTDLERRARLAFLLAINDAVKKIQRARETAAAIARAAAADARPAQGQRSDAVQVPKGIAERLRDIQQRIDGAGVDSSGLVLGGSLRAQALALVRDMEGDGVFPGTLAGPTPGQKQRLEWLTTEVQNVAVKLDELRKTAGQPGAERDRHDGSRASGVLRQRRAVNDGGGVWVEGGQACASGRASSGQQ